MLTFTKQLSRKIQAFPPNFMVKKFPVSFCRNCQFKKNFLNRKLYGKACTLHVSFIGKFIEFGNKIRLQNQIKLQRNYEMTTLKANPILCSEDFGRKLVQNFTKRTGKQLE